MFGISISTCFPRLVATNSYTLPEQNKGTHCRLEFRPISQNALLLLVSGKVSPNITWMFLVSKGLFPSKYTMREFLPKYANFWIDP